MPIEEDSRLIDRARAGDRNAVDELMARSATILRSMVSLRLPGGLRGRTTTEDVVQDVIALALERLPSFDPAVIPWTSWLRRLARSKILDLQRHGFAAKRDVRRQTDADLDGSSPIVARALIASITSPSSGAARAEDLALLVNSLVKCLAQLAEDDREIVLAHCVEGRTDREIGLELEVTEEAVKKRRQRALARLRGAMEGP